MLVALNWRQVLGVGNRISIMVPSVKCWCLTLILEDRGCNILNVGDETVKNRHQHLKVVANTFRLQHLSPTSM